MTIRVFTLRTAILYLLLVSAILVSLVGYFYRDSIHSGKDEIVLLISDHIAKDDPRVVIWEDAAREEGIILAVMHDSEYLRPWVDRSGFAGIILPDHVHATISGVLYHEIQQYVERGGKLMLVYDAGTRAPDNTYFPGKSLFSGLAGVDYAMYDRLRDKTLSAGVVQGIRSSMELLQVPPGKYVPSSKASTPHPLVQRVQRARKEFHTLTGYEYAQFRYPGFVTGNSYPGKVLLVSPVTGLVAGYHAYGRGGTLFVNLPLGYLKGRTDGLLLHGFLRYFAGHVLALPTLSTVPEGVGGLVMNWHVDSNAALQPIQDIEALGIYNQGPYSIHITAGPDTRKFNDKLGLNVSKNTAFQKWIRGEVKRGNVIGSHGGWIHDFFGKNVSEDNQKEFDRFLALNHKALEDASGTPMVEYSAPMGNHPEWVTSWLEDKGYLAYYFTGNAGMGPTRSYRDGRLKHRRIWSFPILTYKDTASFEEMKTENFSSDEVSRWLNAITDFSVHHRVARLVYFHPPGMKLYPQVMRSWLSHTAEIRQRRVPYRWHTMRDLAQFLNEREKVEWSISRNKAHRIITASHPQTLSRQSWFLPKSAYRRPTILKGSAELSDDQHRWLVVAKSGKQLQFTAERIEQ